MNQHQFTTDLQSLQERTYAWGRSVFPLTSSMELEAMGEELHVALEELQAADEELRRQNTELELARGEAKAERRRFQHLPHFTPEGCLVTDLDGTIDEANQAASRLLGVPERFLIGKPLALYVAVEDRLTFRSELMRRLSETSCVDEMLLRLQPRDGAAFTAAVTAAIVIDRRGKPSGLRWTVRDATVRPGPVEQGLQARLEQLTDADRRKDEFLAILAHELRNPLAPLAVSLQMLRRGAAGADPALAVAEHQVQKLTRLVDELLDVSRIRQGKTDLRMERVDLAAVTASAVETVRPLLDERRHVLEVALPPEPMHLEADAGRLDQVLTNLLTNAAKYTEPGGRITLQAERNDGMVVLRVRDTGVGLAVDLLPRIFEPFVQAERNGHRSRGGLGLGLCLVKRFVELHGGSVEARSDGPGRGSEFIVRLPAVTAPPRVEAPPPVAPPPAAVLIVEDNQDAADSLAQLIRLWGHPVTTVYDGPAALVAARANPPGVVLMDLGLPGMDGYETLRRLRAEWKVAPVAAALTGFADADESARVRKAGFDMHLVKPVNLDALKEMLAHVGALTGRSPEWT